MASRSATVLVIFVIAIIAFCLASVFGAMTGPISIFPNETNATSILDNLSSLHDNSGDDSGYSYDTYDYSESSSSDSNVETTTDDSSSDSSSSDQGGSGGQNNTPLP